MFEATSQQDAPAASLALPKWAALVPAILLLAVSGFFAVGLTLDPHALPSTMIDRAMPAFRLEPLAADRPTLRVSDFKGRVTLVNIFGSWCSSCVIEHPMLMEIAQSGDVPVYGVDWRDDPGEGAAWLAKYGDPYAIAGLDADSKLAIDLGVTGAPESFIVDADARIRYKHVGPITPEAWRTVILPIVHRLEGDAP